jgi:hypothetical protein
MPQPLRQAMKPVDDEGLAVAALARRIVVMRGLKVLLDSDLAALYGVPTKVLNQAVKRNRVRFPADFAFELTSEESAALRSQAVTSNAGSRGGRRTAPKVFTEHGALMAATVLNSVRAIEVSVFVVRAFVQLRELLSTHRDLAAKLDELERKLSTHDRTIAELIQAIRQLTAAPAQRSRPIGFMADLDKEIRK